MNSKKINNEIKRLTDEAKQYRLEGNSIGAGRCEGRIDILVARLWSE